MSFETDGTQRQGIDLSKHNWAGKRPVDFEAVRREGVEFAILRAGYGRYETQRDPYFERGHTGARAAGLAVGAYWYSYAVTPAEARKEARLFADAVRGGDWPMGLWFDQEYEPGILALTNAQRTEIVQAFCAEVQKRTGQVCGLYCSRDWINTKLDADQLCGTPLWVAAYTGRDGPGRTALPWTIWQYQGGSGRCPGVDGPVDRNICVCAARQPPGGTLAAMTGLTGQDLRAVQHIIRALGGEAP